MPAPSHSADGQVQIAGLVWYAPQDYAAILRIMADAHLLPQTFEAWHQIARQRESEAKSTGVRVVRAVIDPATFPIWCATRGLNIDARARTSFANDYAAGQIER